MSKNYVGDFLGFMLGEVEWEAEYPNGQTLPKLDRQLGYIWQIYCWDI